MPSGYEKSPDYGGEPPHWKEAVAASAIIGMIGLLYWYYPKPVQKDCWTLGQDEIKITEEDGRQRATLDLRRIPKGECVTINTGPQIR